MRATLGDLAIIQHQDLIRHLHSRQLVGDDDQGAFPAQARQRIDDEVDRLDEWLEGEVVSLRFPTPLARQIAAG